MNKSGLFIKAFMVLICLYSFGCSNSKIKKIKPDDFPEFQFSFKMQDFEVIEYYQYTGNKLFTKYWSNIYLGKVYNSQDTVILLDINSEAPEYISRRKSTSYLIFEQQKQKFHNEVSVAYPDTLVLSKKWQVLCGKLGFLND